MFDLCRKIVAGPKKLLQWNGKQLDLTYVTDRIIAMAFPASGLEKAYRNSINDVAGYLKSKHGSNYLVVNVSSRKYDYKHFNNNVLQYEWRDHLSPALSTLFEIGREMYQYLKKNKSNVIAVHCNHGKGRTGTTIISFLLFTGFFQKYDEALSFYNKRRFISLTYGVSQPCQKRYLSYFENLKSKQNLSPKLIALKLKGIKQKGLQGGKYFLQISSLRKQQAKYKQIYFSSVQSYPNVPVIGDIYIQIFHDKWNKNQQIAVISCHTFFLNQLSFNQVSDENQKKKLMAQRKISTMTISKAKQQKFQGQNIKVNSSHSTNFQISIDFQWYCLCHFNNNVTCPCQEDRIVEQKGWKKTIQNVEVAKKVTKLQACALLFSMQYLHDQTKQLKMSQKKQQKKQIKNGSHQSSQGTKSSHKQGIQNKQGRQDEQSNKQKRKYSYSNSQSQKQYQQQINYSPSNSDYHNSQNIYQNQQFQYDMVIVNRNSTNSV